MRIGAAIGIMGVMTGTALAQPYGLDVRAPNDVLLFPEVPAETPEAHVAVRVWPQVTMPGARRLLSVPTTSEYVVLSPDGVWSFDPNSIATVPPVQWFAAPTDVALLDLVFPQGWVPGDPVLVSGFAGAGNPGELTLSVYTSGGGLEAPLWTLSGVARSGAGGSLARLTDGTLLLAVGDLGTPEQVGISAYAGSILRLDGLSFEPQDAMATGLRLPYPAVDPVMGSLFAMDAVADGPWEANRVEAGSDFGWPEVAGYGCWPVGTVCNAAGLTRPVHAAPFGAADGFAAGAFDYDPESPDLHGWLVTMNSATGEVGALKDTGASSLSYIHLTDFVAGALTGIGNDAEGRVFLLADGGIYTLRPADGEANTFPTRLSQVPAFLAAGLGEDQSAKGIIPYEPSAKLWTDNARKERFLVLPGLARIGFREEDGWDFPVGGGVVKDFILPTDERTGSYAEKRLETRLLLKTGEGWRGFSFRWNDGETDAILLPRALNRPVGITQKDGSHLDYSWFYPSRTDCFMCHTEAANGVLGVNTAQMNYEFTYPASGVRDNQLRALDHISVFTEPLPGAPEDLERMPALDDESAPVALRARAFLHSNCAFCHRPNGGGQIGTDFRWSTPLYEMGIVNDRPSGFDLDIEDAYLVLPRHPEKSVLPARMATVDPAYRMPPLARSRVAEEDLALIREWILELQGNDSWVVR